MKRLLLFLVPLLTVMAFASTAQAATKDKNKDGIPDKWEVKNHLSLKTNQAKKDGDKDKLNNLGEYQSGTNPNKKDTDKDGVNDAKEDADDDGLDNRSEVAVGTSPRKKDTNGDGVADGDTNAGQVVSFANGLLTLKLFGGDTVVGHVVDTTSIFCPPAKTASQVSAARASSNEHPGQSVWQFKGVVTAVDTSARTVTFLIKESENPNHTDYKNQSITFHYAEGAKFYATKPANAVITINDVKVGDKARSGVLLADGTTPDLTVTQESTTLIDDGPTSDGGSTGGNGGNGGSGGTGSGGNGGNGGTEHPGQEAWKFLGKVLAVDVAGRTVTVQVKEAETQDDVDYSGQTLTFHYADGAKFYNAKPAAPITLADVHVGDGVRTGVLVADGGTVDTSTTIEAAGLLNYGPPQNGEDVGDNGTEDNGNHDGNKRPLLNQCTTSALVAGAYVREAALNLDGGQLTFTRVLMARPKK